jgi:hypothetical protein
MPTNIDISITDVGCLEYDDDPRAGRTWCTYRLTSNVKPSALYEYHLGFRANLKKRPKIKPRDDGYGFLCTMDPFNHSQLRVEPFNLIISNVGDGQLRVSVRLPRDMQDVLLVARQGDEQVYRAKAYKLPDENIYYATLIMDASMSVRIEEVDYNTQPLAEEGDSN